MFVDFVELSGRRNVKGVVDERRQFVEQVEKLFFNKIRVQRQQILKFLNHFFVLFRNAKVLKV